MLFAKEDIEVLISFVRDDGCELISLAKVDGCELILFAKGELISFAKDEGECSEVT